MLLCCLGVAVLPFALASGTSRPGVPSWHYPAVFSPIIDGCLVALGLHSARGFALSRRLTGSLITVVLLVAAAADMVLLEDGESNVHVVFALVVALVLPACLTGPQWLRQVLRSRFLVYVGTRSYAVYLVHRMAKGVIDRFILPGGDVLDQLLRSGLITALALAGAEVLRLTVEQPMIRLGRRLTSRDRSGRVALGLEPSVDRPRHPVASLAVEGPAELLARESGDSRNVGSTSLDAAPDEPPSDQRRLRSTVEPNLATEVDADRARAARSTT